MATDPNHVRIVDEALSSPAGMDEHDVSPKMTFAELILFHTLMQAHGIEYVGDERFIPLMQRNAQRIGSIT